MKVPAVQSSQTDQHDQYGGEGEAEDGEGEEERGDKLVHDVLDSGHAAPHLYPRVHGLAEVRLQGAVSVPATVRVARDTAGVWIGAIEVRLPVLVAAGAQHTTALVSLLQTVPHTHHRLLPGRPAQLRPHIDLVELVLYVGPHHEREDDGDYDSRENCGSQAGECWVDVVLSVSEAGRHPASHRQHQGGGAAGHHHDGAGQERAGDKGELVQSDISTFYNAAAWNISSEVGDSLSSSA